MTPLDGVRVLDLTRLLPGAYCTLLLADLGADVVKVEDTDQGDYLRWMPPQDERGSVMFRSLNRNKRSVSLNLRNPDGVTALLRLVRGADIVVEGFRPGVLDRLGAGYAALRSQNPRVILCSITGYGQEGPYRDVAGHDINYAALAGVLGVSGCSPDTIAVPGVQTGDLGGGALHAAVGILAALHERERTGSGSHCDIAMTHGLVAWMAPLLAMQRATGMHIGPQGMVLNGRHPCYRVYRCADGHMSLGALEPKFWVEFVRAIGRPDLEDDQFSDGERRDQVVAAIEAQLLTRTRAEWQQVFAGLDVCCEPVLAVEEVLQHPQAVARQLELDGSVASPVRFAGAADSAVRDAPGHGEHTRTVLIEAGYDDDAIDVLIATGAAR